MDEFWHLIGRSIRTCNLNQRSQSDISHLWQEFFKDPWDQILQNKVNNDVYLVYTDYEGNYQAPYTVFLGYQVAHLGLVPYGLQARTFPPQYMKKRLIKGTQPKACQKAWEEIWAEDAQLPRAYTYDFERHLLAEPAMDQYTVELFLSMKKPLP